MTAAHIYTHYIIRRQDVQDWSQVHAAVAMTASSYISGTDVHRLTTASLIPGNSSRNDSSGTDVQTKSDPR